MKKILLTALVCVSSLRAEISYNSLYKETAAVAVLAVGGSLYVSDKLELEPWVRFLGVALGAWAAKAYYNAWHPENRMKSNTKNFNAMRSDYLWTVVSNAQKNNDFNLSTLITALSQYYVESKDPFYRAGEDMLSLKKQCDAIIKESEALLNFYSSSLYANSEYQVTLTNQRAKAAVMRGALIIALAQLKNSQEYKDALAMRIELDKQEALARIAAAQQTQAMNSYNNPSIVIVR